MKVSSERGVTRRIVLAGGAAVAFAAGARPGRALAGTGSRHGFAPLGTLRYGPAFTHFDYVDPDAPKGGTLRLSRMGAFDTVDTLAARGTAPADLRTTLYDRLIVPSDDEVASYYGALAWSLDVAEDYSRIAFALRPEARWHDGRPVTAADVAFTFARLREAGAPFYRQALATLEVRVEDGVAVFLNARPGDRDVLRRIATIPIHPRHVWEGGVPDAPVGSGPYRLETFDPPHRVVLARVPEWWGRDLPVHRGRFNFDRIVIEFVRDPVAALEGFKAGEADVRTETDPLRWLHGYDGPALRDGRMRKSDARSQSVGDLAALVFNTRRTPLADRNVRLALALAYDAAAANALLFAGEYHPFASVFGDGPLAATGPATGAELDLVRDLPAGALADPDPLAGLPAPGSREALGVASRLLDAAGWSVAAGTRQDASGRPLALSVLSTGTEYDKAIGWYANVLGRIGVGLAVRQADPATSAKMMLARDFDLATLSWSPARLPGTAERLLWHSALADSPRSYALAGLRSAAVDRSVEALERARDEAQLAAAGRAFDRALRAQIAFVPLWRNDRIWTAWWDRFRRPAAEQAGFPPSPIDRWSALEA